MDVIFDPIMAGPNFNENLKSLALDARWVIYGSLGGVKLTGDTHLVRLLMQRASILTSTLRNRSDEYKSNLLKETYKYFT